MKSRPAKILDRLDREYPDAHLELEFGTPFQLLIALILAAQCTDDKVNELTRSFLFAKYRKPEDYLKVPVEELERDIHPTGFFRNKAKAIRRCCEQLIERFGGEVPETVEELTSLFGIGRKSANILLGNAFGQDALGVDTHVGRLSQRLGFTTQSDADKIEADLVAQLPRRYWTHCCHLLQAHGRRVCFARKPNCPGCVVRDLCPYPDKTVAAPPRAKPLRPAFGRRP
ncbi:MAG TPA: endonuclease III [Terriglobales bacterium]|nr:endonuclease III [Terriglobales bacterium]